MRGAGERRVDDAGRLCSWKIFWVNSAPWLIWDLSGFVVFVVWQPSGFSQS